MRNEKSAGILLSYLLVVVEAITGILLTIVLIDNLGQDEYGLYKLATSWVSMVSVLDFGLGSTITRYTLKYRTNGDVAGERKFIGIAFAIYFFLSAIVLVVGALMCVFLPVFSSSIRPESILEFRFVFMLLVGKTSVVLFNHAYVGRFNAVERFVYIKLVNISNFIFRLGLIAVIISIVPSPVMVALIDLVLVCVQLFCNVIASRKFGFEKIKFYGWDKELFIELFSFTSSIFIASIVNQFNSNVDTIVLGIFSTTAMVGLYAAVMQIYTIFSSLSTAIQGIFFAQVSKTVFEKKNDIEITKSIILPSRLQIIVLFLALSGFIVFGDDFLKFWIGATYTSQQINIAYIVGIIVMSSSMWQLFQNSATSILKAKNLLRGRVVITGVTTITNFIITFILVPKYGMIGAAIGTAVSMIFGYGIVMNIYYLKVAKINLRLYYRKTFYKLCYVLPLLFIVGVLIDNAIGNTIWLLIIKIAIYILVYSVAVLLFGLNKTEKEYFKSKMLRKITK